MVNRAAWAVARAQSAVLLARVDRRVRGLLQKYDEDEPRDEDGQWTDGGGGSGGDGGSSGGGGGGGTAPGPGIHATGVKPAEAKTEHWSKASPYKGMSAQQVVDHAAKAQASFVGPAEKVATKTGTTFINPGSKQIKSMQIKFDRGRTPQSITDAVRGGFLVNTPAQADEVTKELAKTHPILDEGWVKTDAGYFDRKLIVQMPDKSLAEVQLWPPAMYDAKHKEGGAALYDQTKPLAKDDPQRAVLNQQMNELYARAADRLPASWNAISGKGGKSGYIDS